jgi:hypothetical protein
VVIGFFFASNYSYLHFGGKLNQGITGFEWLGTLAVIAIFWIVPSFLVGKAAAKKKRSFWAFFFISFFFSWVLGGIIVAIMKRED